MKTGKLTNEQIDNALAVIARAIVDGRIIDGNMQVTQKLVKNMQDQLTQKNHIDITIAVVIEAEKEMVFS